MACSALMKYARATNLLYHTRCLMVILQCEASTYKLVEELVLLHLKSIQAVRLVGQQSGFCEHP